MITYKQCVIIFEGKVCKNIMTIHLKGDIIESYC